MKILDIIVEQHAYTVTQFALNVFESFSDYRRWSRGPKTSKRGATRYSVDKYENIFVLPNALHESHSTFAQKKQEARVFSAAFTSYDERDTVEIAVGNSLAVLSATLVPGDSVSRIEISGFVQPKRIVAINLDANDRIDTLEFSDGSIFPEAAEFTTVGGTNITNTIFFSDATSASRAYTAIWMQIVALEHNGWTVESAISESRDSSLIERKRKRKRKTTRTVYGGWWGGYYGDNSSAEGGGEGVAESALSWSTLNDSLSVEDKLTILEEYHCKNTLLESNSESSAENFKSLFELSDEPVAKQRYIVVPLMLVSNKVMQLDHPRIMKYVGSRTGALIFTHNNTEREYPSTTLRNRSLSHTFTFASSVAYDKFRIALRLQFDVDLPNVDRNIDEASYVNEVAEGRQEYALNLESIEEKFGQIKLQGGIVRNNQTLLRYLSKNNVSTAVFDHLIEQKIDKITKNKIITESIDANDKNLKAIFSQFNNFSTGNRVKVGDSVSVLNLEALQLSGNTIELTGFLQPQTITAVNNNYVEFESGEIFPKQPILQLRMWRQIIFFHSVEHAKKCLMVMQLHSGKTGDWEFSINVQQDVREASSAAQQAAIAISMKRAGKKPQHNK